MIRRRASPPSDHKVIHVYYRHEFFEVDNGFLAALKKKFFGRHDGCESGRGVVSVREIVHADSAMVSAIPVFGGFVIIPGMREDKIPAVRAWPGRLGIEPVDAF